MEMVPVKVGCQTHTHVVKSLSSESRYCFTDFAQEFGWSEFCSSEVHVEQLKKHVKNVICYFLRIFFIFASQVAIWLYFRFL